eukprot:GEMP01051480.1.p1 GENE.GEMP01051480.1~~GEMP01051480.1.p1  ORF type:complete len:276 (+),score=39.21 GEMP01051480.1:80-907(+)
MKPDVLDNSLLLSRNSGLRVSPRGSWGRSARFDVHGKHSATPSGELYYARSTCYSKRVGRMSSFGVCGRPNYSPGPPELGPGCYGIPYKPRNARYQDIKLKSRVNIEAPVDYSAPGPGQYEIPTTLHDCRTCAIHPPLPYILQPFHEVSQMDSAEQARHMNSTFGTGDRSAKPLQTSTPDGNLYYCHSKILTGDDYQKHSRSCNFGKGRRTAVGYSDHDAPINNNVTLCMARSWSALDGFREVGLPASSVIHKSSKLSKGQARSTGSLAKQTESQ